MCRWSASTSHAGGVCRLHRVRTSSPRDTWQPPLQLHMRGKLPTASATLVQTFSAEGKVALEPWIWQAGRHKSATQVTTSLQPRWPKRRGALDFLCPPALGIYVPCASWLVGVPLRPCRLLLCAANHRNARHTPESCPRPTGTHRKWATHPRPLPIFDCLRLLGEANRDPGPEH